MLLRNSFFHRLLLAAAMTPVLAVILGAARSPEPWPENAFVPLTGERIAELPEAERPVWREYFARSRSIAAGLPKRLPDKSPSVAPQPTTGSRHSQGLRDDGPKEQYATEQARTLADRVVLWQSVAGGWTKGIDYLASPDTAKNRGDAWSAGTFDNNATITELRYLARVISASGKSGVREDSWRGSFLKGLQYVFNAQYPNGGYPQIYPLVGGYHDGITYNDNAMVRVLEFLSDVAAGAGDYGFVPEVKRAEAARRVDQGVGCLLKTQIVDGAGRRTAWCQQHDMLTLKPSAARKFEPIAVSVGESTALVRFLMKRVPATPEVVAAVDDAAAWLGKVALKDVVWDRSELPTRLVPSAGAPLLWARLYEIGTDVPVFGDRDQFVHYEVGELSAERQKGYAWFGTWATGVLVEYKKWRASAKQPGSAGEAHFK